MSAVTNIYIVYAVKQKTYTENPRLLCECTQFEQAAKFFENK